MGDIREWAREPARVRRSSEASRNGLPPPAGVSHLAVGSGLVDTRQQDGSRARPWRPTIPWTREERWGGLAVVAIGVLAVGIHDVVVGQPGSSGSFPLWVFRTLVGLAVVVASVAALALVVAVPVFAIARRTGRMPAAGGFRATWRSILRGQLWYGCVALAGLVAAVCLARRDGVIPRWEFGWLSSDALVFHLRVLGPAVHRAPGVAALLFGSQLLALLACAGAIRRALPSVYAGFTGFVWALTVGSVSLALGAAATAVVAGKLLGGPATAPPSRPAPGGHTSASPSVSSTRLAVPATRGATRPAAGPGAAKRHGRGKRHVPTR